MSQSRLVPLIQRAKRGHVLVPWILLFVLAVLDREFGLGGASPLVAAVIPSLWPRKARNQSAPSPPPFPPSPDIQWCADATGVFLTGNQRWKNVLQCHEDSWERAIHPEDRAHWREAWSAAVASGTPFVARYRLKTPDHAEYRWHLGRAEFAAQNDDGGSFWWGSSADIHEVILETQSTQERADHTQSLLENVPQLVWTCNENGECDYLSRQWVDYTGVPEAEQLGFGWTEALHPDDRDRATAAWQEAVAEKSIFDVEFRIRNARGVYRWFKTRAVRLPGTDGPAKWFGTNTDIDDLRQAEQEVLTLNAKLESHVESRTQELIRINTDLRARTKSLIETQNRLEAILAAATETSIITTDTDGLITTFNVGAERMLGYTSEEVVGLHTPALFHDKDEVKTLGKELSQSLGRVVQGFDVFVAEARQGSATVREWTYIHKNGARRRVELSVTAHYDESGQIAGFLGIARDVTEERRAEQTLRDNEERLRLLIEGATDYAVFMLGESGYIDSWNAGAERLFGYAASEVLGEPYEIIHYLDSYDDDLAQNPINCALRDGRFEEDGWLQRKDGSTFWATVSVSPVFDVNGFHRGFATFIRDISERRTLQAQLEANEILLRQFIKHSPAAIAMFDENICYLQCSDRWIEDYGLQGKDILGKSHYTIFPEISDEWKAIHQRVLQGAVESNPEERFVRADGSTHWLQWECQPWRQSGGEIGGLIMFTQSITERKLAEIRQREQEERFRSAFDDAPIGMALVSTEGRWLRVNQALTHMFGYSESEFLATDFQSLTHDEDMGEDLALVQECLSGKRHSYQLRKRYFSRDGSVIHGLLSVSLVHDHEGAPIYFVSQIVDVSEVQKQQDIIQRSLNEKDVLLREIHHRVKNNLQIISTLLELQSDYVEDEAALAVFDESCTRVRSMALIHDRLYNSGDLANVPIDDYVHQLVNELFRTYRFDNNNVEFVMETGISNLPIDVAIPCGLLLNELMSNSLKHGLRGVEGGRLSVSLTRHGEHALLCVADNGHGLPEGLDIYNTESFGLQLVITLAEQLGGVIELEPGKGARFQIEFPIPNIDPVGVA